ncbi:metal ABC transporter permease [Ketobacter sp.]|uniref:metal ABC transporter permease n=1 Tax=Ketobacter sp. TaxID=2083498 RepID=UPI000F117E91|nr:metal ABC transporter permease [Ketobacter sp.]RLT93080.1 MAG: metal ABC transporter permease [Ketobacter sp.]
MSWQDWSLIGPALIAGLIIIISHVPLGIEVVKRGIIFIDLAVAQIAGVGLIVARMLDVSSYLGQQLIAGTAAIGGALLLTLTESRLGRYQEPLIGVLFVLAATLGLLLLAGDPHGGESLKELLSGQILWVTLDQVYSSALLLLPATVLWLLLRQRYARFIFYPLFAVIITLSVQLVGVYLVFASLVIPALATVNCSRYRLLTAMTVGILAYWLGLLASLYWDLAAAPLIVWCLALLSALYLIPSLARTPAKT